MKLFIKESNSNSKKCSAWLATAYIDDPVRCTCCGKKFPAGHNTVYLDGHEPDGMHFIYTYTQENRDGNSINYNPYNLPPEDAEGGIFKVWVGEDDDDEGYRWLPFCHTCWPKLTDMTPDEIYAQYSGTDINVPEEEWENPDLSDDEPETPFSIDIDFDPSKKIKELIERFQENGYYVDGYRAMFTNMELYIDLTQGTPNGEIQFGDEMLNEFCSHIAEEENLNYNLETLGDDYFVVTFSPQF